MLPQIVLYLPNIQLYFPQNTNDFFPEYNSICTIYDCIKLGIDGSFQIVVGGNMSDIDASSNTNSTTIEKKYVVGDQTSL